MKDFMKDFLPAKWTQWTLDDRLAGSSNNLLGIIIVAKCIGMYMQYVCLAFSFWSYGLIIFGQLCNFYKVSKTLQVILPLSNKGF